ncbi:MAG: CPBP family glutamic-type intramembrane protease [Actinomycetota bacterium]|nr:CPBP family glutamic-type intramembrane protease [Actinomycetota bacterium]
MERCETGALKVGVSYIYVDWRKCGGCLACVKVCKSNAIQERVTHSAPQRRSTTPSGRRKSSGRAAPGKSGEHPGWTLQEAAIVLAVVLLAFVAKDAALTSSFVGGLSRSMGIFLRAVVLGLFYVVQLLPLLVLARRHGGFAPAYGLERREGPWWRVVVTTGFVLGLLIITRLFTAFYGALVQYFGWSPPAAAAGDLTDVFGGGSAGLVLAVLLVVFVGPLIEEIVFRSVLLSAFRERWGDWAAILLSASLFGLYHFSAWMFLPAFALGVALGWLANSREGLWPPLVLHALYNGVAVAAAFYVAAA